jgi:anti-sigma regulatory factor (Ser/Thr protein kinase)
MNGVPTLMRRVVFGSFPSLPASVPEARALVHRLDGAVSVSSAQDLQLLVSELVTNSVLHGPDGDVSVTITADDGVVRVEVADGGEGAMQVKLATADDEHGRGLMLVDALAERWGSEATPHTLVWAEVPENR